MELTVRSPLVASKTSLTIDRLRNPSKVKMAYTPDSIWRNRDTFIKGRDEIERFLTDKWNREHKYMLRKELFAFDNDKVSALGSD
jgi:nuclear transport factor 2 (NTF2) superfamily protein